MNTIRLFIRICTVMVGFNTTHTDTTILHCLISTTINPADLIGASVQFGTLEPGNHRRATQSFGGCNGVSGCGVCDEGLRGVFINTYTPMIRHGDDMTYIVYMKNKGFDS